MPGCFLNNWRKTTMMAKGKVRRVAKLAMETARGTNNQEYSFVLTLYSQPASHPFRVCLMLLVFRRIRVDSQLPRLIHLQEFAQWPVIFDGPIFSGHACRVMVADGLTRPTQGLTADVVCDISW
jgi:hypothetical protein